MASSDKADLARAGTMEVTSKEGRAYLEKNLTEWKKPLLIDQDVDDSKGLAGKKGRGKKVAIKEPEQDDEEQDDDDEEEEEEEEDEEPATKKARLSKATTMEVTAKEGKQLIGNKKLGDTRQVTKSKQAKPSPQRATTMVKAVEEAKAVYGKIDSSEGRSMRKRAAVVLSPAKKQNKSKPAKKAAVAKKAALKKAGTMVATAKEGAQLIGDEELGDTRLVTKAKKARAAAACKKSPKKAGKKKSK